MTEIEVPTIIVLLFVLLAIAFLPKYKHHLKKLHHNLAGLIFGFICVIMFFLVDPKVATLLLFVMLVFFYTAMKEETFDTLENYTNDIYEARRKAVEDAEIAVKVDSAVQKINSSCSELKESVDSTIDAGLRVSGLGGIISLLRFPLEF